MTPRDGRAPAEAGRWAPGTLLHVLGDDDRRCLLELGTRRTFPPGATLIDEGAAGGDVFVLLDGYCKVLGNTVDGRAVLLSIRCQGEVVGEMAALDQRPRSASVVALTEVAARVVTQRAFLGYLRERPPAARALQTAILGEFRRVTRHRLFISGAPAVVRLVLVLNYLADVYGRPCAEGVRIEVPLSQPELASLIGVSEPSLHRAVTELRTREVISTRYRRMVVRDPAALRALAAHGADPAVAVPGVTEDDVDL
ncbi:Crp/Fnr family transcriptional regulator [Nonomuraea sp. NPDC050643]|uniref:Crp/Fnr family transcriptional regulator n=1 Tax=Nonomuraea sp. NPDC050643 TaxID=3155660 RepID=UPI0033FBB2D0